MNNISSLQLSSVNTGLLPQKGTHAFSEGEAPVFDSGSDSISLGKEPLSEPLKKWTVLHYAAADNNLSPIIDNIIDLESVGSDANTNFLVQLDNGKKGFPDKNVTSGAKRYYLNKSDDLTQISSSVLENLGKVNMADPKVLSDFITWGIKNYPAENYMIFLSSHGNFWTGAIEDSSRGSNMSIPEIRQAFEDSEKKTGEKVDLICFDACNMATLEVANELSGVADFMVASQNTIQADGFPYSSIFGDNENNSTDKVDFNFSPKEAASRIIKASSNSDSVQTLSAVELSKLSSLNDSVNKFAQAIIENKTEKRALKDLASKVRNFEMNNEYNVIDLYYLAYVITRSDSEIKEPALKEAAQNILDSVKNTVFENYSERGFGDANGLSIEASSYRLGTKKYQELSFAKAALWDEAMGEDNVVFKAMNKVKDFLGF